MMCDDFFLNLKKRIYSSSLQLGRGGLQRFTGDRKIAILVILILISIASLSCFCFLGDEVLAQKSVFEVKLKSENIDPLERIGKGIISQKENPLNVCVKPSLLNSEISDKKDSDNDFYENMVAGHPIAEMVPEILLQDKKVAAFLLGIAKKESDWGKHSPQKNGRTCYNYWGYRGGYNATDSGYSCFDSPEQAVAVVGGRISELINKNIDTPARMVVWKCGSSCAGHDPAGVKKWISDVKLYYDRINS